MNNINLNIEKWKKRLLDLGKRNRLINYRETKRSNINITSPNLKDLYTRLVLNEEALTFSYSNQNDPDDTEIINIDYLIKGDIETNRTIKEQQKTLGNLRSKTKTAAEEQGINVLYLSAGFLKWTESSHSGQLLASPIILIPVTLNLESIASPFVLALHEDEIVINPTLSHKLENDFGINLPTFDSYEDDIEDFLYRIKEIVNGNKWDVSFDVGLSMLSFLKINMYRDLDRNTDKIVSHSIIRALSGDTTGIVSLSAEYDNFNHDEKIKPIDTYQVLDADASQQDAVLYSKKGVSFVLQGPPGTGKSQTITNIIAENLADGKKVLFISAKDAALKVVHKRLSQAGLSDFCLNLHSHKANKKEILNELNKTLSLNKFKLQDDAVSRLESLKADRDRLNRYTIELHTPCPPLGKSIWDINGEIAKLYATHDIIFHIDNVGETTRESLNEYKYLLTNFVNTIGKMSEDYTVNPWRSCHLPNVSHESRHDIETILKRLTPKLKDLIDCTYKCVDGLDLNKRISIYFINDLIDILNVASRSPKIPLSWLYEEDIAVLSTKAEKFQTFKAEYKSLQEYLSQKYTDNGFFALPAHEIYSKLKVATDKARQMVNPLTYKTDAEIAVSSQNIVAILEMCIKEIASLESISAKSVDLLGGKEPRNIEDAIALTNLTKNLLADPKPTKEWFDAEKFKNVKRLLTAARSKHEYLSTEKINILSEYDMEIFSIDYSSMLKRFKVEYSSIFKILKKSYWADKNTIKALTKDIGKKIDDNLIVDILSKLKTIAEKELWVSENTDSMATFFGSHYLKEHTDWVDFEKAIDVFEEIVRYFGVNGIPEKTKEILMSESSKTSIAQLYEQLNDLWAANLHIVVDQTLAFGDKANSIDYGTFTTGIKTALSTFTDLSIEYKKTIQFCNQNMTYEDALQNLSKLVSLQDIAQKIEVENENLQKEYQFLFNGIETDWINILASLVWTEDFKKLNVKHVFTDSFIKKICHDEESITYSAEAAREIKQKFIDLQHEWDWYLALFDDQHELLNTELHQLLTRVEASTGSLSALEEWIDFRSSREECKKNGLSDYIEKIETLKIESRLILPSFLKRFYRLWLDAVTPKYPAVYSFRRRTQDPLIKRFSQLDKDQLSIARARVKHGLVSRLPDFNNKFTSAVDEVSILKRELNKQRKIMPLRKLFRAIPNLLLTLKPCLMMSPLSVSLFLEDESYKFDVVIFDEASQVCTEDAIGAIMRGNQVVIAGDSKQLPPTNFFAVNTSDNEFDADDNADEYDSTDAYQSILDESVSVLPERTLRWHYRSRHEHLIAFSNAKVYNHNLITFPSYIEQAPDNGVEYIYVPNGVYDRSGKRNNITEAKKVADLVFEHISKYPGRSLGVVTFSEAQQQVVEEAIRQRRLLNQQHESFFTEDKEENFFVKNLENVQGDERDTIIFSIGYAKDQNGVMYMNFGPLSREGGYRRLNVAITRAKFNVKLVGSIHPTDINIENTSAEGVKMLRSYIEFAINGIDVLQKELMVSDAINVESPFEESVYDFLVSKGYKVATQVGCSGYRIDLAVKHPSLNGIFVLGVECDGATYHSARTARERDRLRQSILEDIGWKIYRIWSTDWIKDPVTEGQNLLDAINDAISRYVEDDLGLDTTDRNQDKYFPENKFVTIEMPVDSSAAAVLDSSNPYNLPFYAEADISKVPPHRTQSIYQANVIKYVVEQEYPIHFELLCKRVASIFGYQKATANVRKLVQVTINKQLKDQIQKIGDFYWVKDEGVVRARIRNWDKTDRKIEYISTEELAEAMFIIASKSVGILEDDLLVETARMFGFYRTGGNIIQSMQKTCIYLLEIGKVKNSSGKIVIN